MTTPNNRDLSLTPAAIAAAAAVAVVAVAVAVVAVAVAVVAVAVAVAVAGNQFSVAFALLQHALADKNDNGMLSINEWKAARLYQSVGRFKEVKGHKHGVTAHEFLQARQSNNQAHPK